MDLLYQLQMLLPLAIKWAEEHSEKIQNEGTPLTAEEIKLAKQVGVTNPEKVKILEVAEIPMPENEELNEAAVQIGFLNESMTGLTLGHSIYICNGQNTTRLLSHELRHVYQYETFGSISEFLIEYLKQIVFVGYENSILEQDARNHEIFI
ncbi:MAG: hypothetical protein HND53_07725 [Proteobacteria bacterium]|nr:hypothetical protein [Pseudomonadota bacterium]NOG60370.1 hypothetical protein [Pseudomonadota bacterium]